MNIQRNVSLKAHSTMRLGGHAEYLCEVSKQSEISGLVAWAKKRDLPVIMIGDGSNIVWRDEGFPGLVLINKIKGFEISKVDVYGTVAKLGAGENWDSIVERIVSKGFNGVAELSLIPGTVGATPVQNVGAYGREISEVLISVVAYDSQKDKFVTIAKTDCDFAYRSSRFKTTDRGRFLITSIVLKLSKDKPAPPFYESVQHYFDDNQITDYSPQNIRKAVIAIRSAKLPDPSVIANNGSFFANPIISPDKLERIKKAFPNIPHWQNPDGSIKVAAAWLVEQAGFKDMHDKVTGMGTWPKQALVLVNEHAHTTADLLAFKQKIVNSVQKKFEITLEQEPELLP